MYTKISKDLKEIFPLSLSGNLISLKRNSLHKYLSDQFRCLGGKISTSPTGFIIYPIFLSIILGTGFQALKMKTDLEYYITPPEGDAITDRTYIESLFILNMSSNFDPSKRTRDGRFGSVIALPKDGESVLRKTIFDEVMQLDKRIQQISIDWDGRRWTYADICAKYNNKCFKNIVLLISKNIEEFERGNFALKYPVHHTRSADISLLALGGIKKNESDYVKSATSVSLNYFLDTGRESRDIMSQLWEEEFLDLLKSPNFDTITIEKSISTSFDKDIAKGSLLSIPYIPASIFLVVIFTIITCCTSDWVKSKPWTGIFTAVSSGLALTSGLGVVIYAGFPFVSLNMIIPFLVLGIGMDDTFVMLSSWKRTDSKYSLEERLSKTYSEAGVSITLTSLTNFVSFLLGWIFGSYPSIRVFCVYMASCVAFDYLYQITFVGACLALCGRAEKRNLHCLTFLPVKKEPYTGPLKLFYKLFCVVSATEESGKSRTYSLAIFDEFWNFVGKAMTWRFTKIVALLFYIIYLIIAVWGATKVTETDGHEGVTIYNSSANRYLKTSFANYYKDRERIQFVINASLNYADLQVQKEIEAMVQNFETHPFLSGPTLTEFWLQSYLKFLQYNFIPGYNITDLQDFILILKRVFLKHPLTSRFKDDIVFDNNGTSIIASRFFCQTNVTKNYKDFRVQARSFKEIVKEAPYPVIFYHPLFPSFEGLNSMVSNAIQTLAMITGTVAIISWIFLPGFTSTLCVSYSIISIGIGVVGYMSLWDVSLSNISLTTLIIVLGMSVDYGAHVSCAYICSDTKDLNEKLRDAVTLVAMPIFQGCFTSILSVVVFIFIPTLALTVVIKMITLVCLIAAVHAIVFLPVLLYFTDYFIDVIKPKLCKKNGKFVLKQNSKNEVNEVKQIERPQVISFIDVTS